MLRAVVAWLVVAGCYAPHAPEGEPCTLDRDCPSEQRCIHNACMRGVPPDDAPLDTSDAPSDTTDAAATTCPTFAILCDDFESGTTAKWTTKRLGTGATVSIDGTHAHSGTLALDATVPASTTSGAGAVLVSKLASPQSTGVLALREWIYAPQPIIHFAGVVQFRNAMASNYVIGAGDDSNLWVATEDSTAGLVDHRSMTKALDSTWVCVEQDYLFAGAMSKIQFFVDDHIVIDAVAADPMPVYTNVEAGVARASVDGFRVFVDDVVIAAQHIGCQ
jgi:hypothetical protein